ncbi:MAG TPA: CpaF family protein [Chloroflexia bacterium]|nr:CpaF family protein [Chloroflexia bacterium]
MPIIRRKSDGSSTTPTSSSQPKPPSQPPLPAGPDTGASGDSQPFRSFPSNGSSMATNTNATNMATRLNAARLGTQTAGARTPGSNMSRSNRLDLEQRLHGRIIADLRDTVDLSDAVGLRAEIERLFNRYMADEDVVLNRAERGKVFEQVYAEIQGYGPLQQLLNSDTVSEIMVNGPHQVWVEREGKISLTDITFKDDEHVMRIISRIVAPLGRRCDESSPMVDARLPDGSRVNAIIPPLSLIGPVLTVRKFRRVPLSVDDLISSGSLSQQSVIFLEAAVRAGLNVLVAGGTSSGKTTLLNVLSSFIPEEERIITVEDAAELQLQQVHVIPLESRPASLEGMNQVSIRDLVMNCLRMRPDRIVVGECRGKEALDMLQAMNTGHDGCMTTVHANTPRDALSRIETMSIMAAAELPLRAIREQISSAFDLIVYCERLDDGTRKVTYVTEVQGFEQETILLQNIFQLEWVQRGDQRVRELVATGIRPQVMRKIEKARIFLAPDFFLPPAEVLANQRMTR